MKETAIIFYGILLQVNIVTLTTGVLTYLRYRKESLRYFLMIYGSLQLLQLGLLLKACSVYASKETIVLHNMVSFLGLVGTLVLLFVLPVFPLYMTGRKPGKLLKVMAAVLAFAFITGVLFWPNKGTTIFLLINKTIIAFVLFSSTVIILSSLRNIRRSSKYKAIGYILGISVILLPGIFAKSAQDSLALYQSIWSSKPLVLLFFLLLTNCGGLLLIKTYFDVPFYVNPEDGKLSEYFISKYNITEREGEIIMLLQKGKAYKEIAEELTIAYKTVDAHIQNIYSKTAVSSRRQLVNLIETSSI
jgi:DNA-binding CsgD family transcriptional regulator